MLLYSILQADRMSILYDDTNLYTHSNEVYGAPLYNVTVLFSSL